MPGRCVRAVLVFAAVWGMVLPAWAGPEALRVGVAADFPPLIYKEAGKIVGLEADLAKALGEELGRPVTFVEIAWADLIPKLAEGKFDIVMSGMSVTPARQVRVAFSEPYLVVGQTVLVRREDANDYMLGFPANPQGTIGVLKSTTGDFLVQQEFARSKRKAFDTPQAAAKALQKGKIDLFICDSPVVWWMAGMNEAQGLVPVRVLLTREPLAWAMRKSDGELLESVNAALESMRADGRTSAIIKRWLPQAE